MTRDRLLLGCAWSLLIAVGIVWFVYIHPSALLPWAAVVVLCIAFAIYDSETNDLPWEFFKLSLWFGIGMTIIISFTSLSYSKSGMDGWFINGSSAVGFLIYAFYSLRDSSNPSVIHIRGRRVVEFTSVEYVSRRSVRNTQSVPTARSQDVNDFETDSDKENCS
ncbi:hypothetical protein Mal65_11380 [Crateriforma conspicua]|nr:hypothetical protein Mal65_11380 [Crateriforma conspicua]